MIFNVATDLTKLDKDELYALQANLERVIGQGNLDDERTTVLLDYLERVDDEILTRASLA